MVGDREPGAGALDRDGTQEGRDGGARGLSPCHLGERLAGTFGPTQQGLSIARQGPAPSPWDRCQVDSLTWKLMWFTATPPVKEMVSTRWKGTRCVY